MFDKICANLFWNGLIRFGLEIYLEMLIVTTIEFTSPSFANFGGYFSYCHAVFFMFLAVSLEVSLIWYYRNFHRFPEPDFQEQYGSMINGLKRKEGRAVLLYPLFYMARRQAMVLISLHTKQVWLQI